MTADELVKAVALWAENHVDIVSVALVGSHARGNARVDSDVDLVIQCASPARYLGDLSWISEFGVAKDVSVEDYGVVQSVRVFYEDGPEVEYGITSSEWATLPLDEGTLKVLRDGVKVLLDRDGSLNRAVELALARRGSS
ncbi:MAG TPA: nucleotidyltransferase domain-containing protein [Pyrinomonadaceae bacterium]|nr:nucleotidyltransferase domain-containing protein [Pyrinomonadaceae bacterium]